MPSDSLFIVNLDECMLYDYTPLLLSQQIFTLPLTLLEESGI
jgi:hypothetical protein